MSFWSGKFRWSAMTATLLALLCWCPAHAAQAPAPNGRAHGNYDVVCGGVIKGDLKATVSAKHVHFVGTVQDEKGNNVAIDGKVDLEGWRFKGKLNTGLGELDLHGRVDPPDNVLPDARLICTVKSNTNKFGRMVGSRKKK